MEPPRLVQRRTTYPHPGFPGIVSRVTFTALLLLENL